MLFGVVAGAWCCAVLCLLCCDFLCCVVLRVVYTEQLCQVVMLVLRGATVPCYLFDGSLRVLDEGTPGRISLRVVMATP